MARPLRIEFPGAWYHVMNRGSGRKWIFKTDEQRTYFLSLLSEVTSRFAADIHAYCLMDNHYHLMIRTPEGNLQRIMRHINGVYTQYINRAERRDGPLFRGRYRAILVNADSYWLQLSRYVHRNPLEAGIVKKLESYSWSSYPAYIGKTNKPDWLNTHTVLAAIGKRKQGERYKSYVHGDTDTELTDFYQKRKTSPILGDEEFRKVILEDIRVNEDIPESRSERLKPDVEQIIQIVSAYYDVEPTSLRISTRGRGVTSPARSIAMYLCQTVSGMTLALIAEAFGLAGYASAGSTIRTIRQRLQEDRELRRDLKYLIPILTQRP